MPSSPDYLDQFPILAQLDFFNHAGVAPISGPAAQAMRGFIEQSTLRSYHQSDWYRQARQVKRLAARFLGAADSEGSEIAFVPNTSTGLALVARGLAWKPGDQVVISNVEYPANRYPWEDLKRFGVKLVEVPQRPDGVIDPADVQEAVTDRTRVVALSHVQYASGYRIDLRPIADTVHQVRGYLCVDAIQSLGAMPVNVRHLGIDFLAADGHKWLLGPEGCGLFYCRAELAEELHPAVVGWMNMVHAEDYGNYRFKFQPDARRFEAGSYNIPGILGLGASLEYLMRIGLDIVWARIGALTDRLCDGLRARGYRVFSPRLSAPGAAPGGAAAGALTRSVFADTRSGIVSFLPPADRPTPPLRRIVTDLEQRKIIIVVREGRLRASPHFYNTPAQIDRLVEALP